MTPRAPLSDEQERFIAAMTATLAGWTDRSVGVTAARLLVPTGGADTDELSQLLGAGVGVACSFVMAVARELDQDPSAIWARFAQGLQR